MKTVTSVSGGKTSAYLAANYPTDYNVFALVTTSDKTCLYPDKKLRQVVGDRIGREFIGCSKLPPWTQEKQPCKCHHKRCERTCMSCPTCMCRARNGGKQAAAVAVAVADVGN